MSESAVVLQTKSISVTLQSFVQRPLLDILIVLYKCPPEL